MALYRSVLLTLYSIPIVPSLKVILFFISNFMSYFIYLIFENILLNCFIEYSFSFFFTFTFIFIFLTIYIYCYRFVTQQGTTNLIFFIFLGEVVHTFIQILLTHF